MRQSSYQRKNILSFPLTFESVTPSWTQWRQHTNFIMQKPFMTTFTTLFAIQQHSWTTEVWIGESLKRLYEQLSGFCFQYASIDFQLKTCFAWLYRVSKFCSVHSLCECLLAASKMPQRSQIPLVLSLRKKVVKEDSLGAKLIISNNFFSKCSCQPENAK